jgi:parallel beta-helix repeat protein
MSDSFSGAGCFERVLGGMLVTGALAALPAPVEAAAWYVDGVHGSITWPASRCANGVAEGTDPSCAFQQLWQALHEVAPGDTIYVANSMTYPKLGLTVGGTATAPVTLSGYDIGNTGKPTYVSGGGVDVGIWIDANYVVVSNFNVTAPGPYAGISVNPYIHHVTITNNVVQNAGGNGINVYQNDYVTVSHNIVYDNAHNTSKAFNSGISLKYSQNTDASTAVKMVVDSNVVYANTNIPNCSTAQCLATATDTDGNGIILDRNSLQSVPYAGAFVVRNNVVYKNGGRGIWVFHSDNATVTGNTVYENNRDPYFSYYHPGEISVGYGGNVWIYDNIAYSDGLNGLGSTPTAPNTHVSLSFEYCTDGHPIVAEHNLTYDPQNASKWLSYGKNNTSPITLASNIWANPLFEATLSYDFRLQPASPGYLTANPATSPALDILGVTRAPLPSMGAYQNAGP